MKYLRRKMKTKVGTKHSKFKLHNLLFKSLITPLTETLKNIPSIPKLPNIQSENKFSRKDLIFLKEHTGHRKKVIEKWCEQFKKDCLDGYISSQDLEYACDFFFPYIDAKPFCAYIYKIFDTDQKGIISLDVLTLAVVNMEFDNGMVEMTSDEKVKRAIVAHGILVIIERLYKICNVK